MLRKMCAVVSHWAIAPGLCVMAYCDQSPGF